MVAAKLLHFLVAGQKSRVSASSSV